MVDYIIYIDKGAETETTAGSCYNLDLAIEIAGRVKQTVYAGRKPKKVEVGFFNEDGRFIVMFFTGPLELI